MYCRLEVMQPLIKTDKYPDSLLPPRVTLNHRTAVRRRGEQPSLNAQLQRFGNTLLCLII